MSALPPDERAATLAAAVTLFDGGRYLAAHELFEELWEATEGDDSDFYKGLVQAAVALHHLAAGNAEGAARLHSSHRALLARYQPEHLGLEVGRFLEEMRRRFQAGAAGPAPRLGPARAAARGIGETTRE